MFACVNAVFGRLFSLSKKCILKNHGVQFRVADINRILAHSTPTTHSIGTCFFFLKLVSMFRFWASLEILGWMNMYFVVFGVGVFLIFVKNCFGVF